MLLLPLTVPELRGEIKFMNLFFLYLITAELPMRAVTHGGNPNKASIEYSKAK